MMNSTYTMIINSDDTNIECSFTIILIPSNNVSMQDKQKNLFFYEIYSINCMQTGIRMLWRYDNAIQLSLQNKLQLNRYFAFDVNYKSIFQFLTPTLCIGTKFSITRYLVWWCPFQKEAYIQKLGITSAIYIIIRAKWKSWAGPHP